MPNYDLWRAERASPTRNYGPDAADPTPTGDNMPKLDDLTIGQAKELAALFGGGAPINVPASGELKPVLVCTDRRGVFFGYTDNALADPLTLKDARMCIYWTSNIGGVQGLAESGPFDATKNGEGSRIGAPANAILKGITAVFEVNEAAAVVWKDAPIYGRGK